MTLANSGSLTAQAHPRIEWSIPPLRKRRYTKYSWMRAVNDTVDGTTGPTRTTQALGASGGVKAPILRFSDTADNQVFFEWPVPDELDPDQSVYFGFEWLINTTYASGNFYYVLDYLIKNNTGVAFDTGTPTSITSNTTPTGLAGQTLLTEFSSTITVALNQIISCQFYRDVSEDTCALVGLVRFFYFRYEAFKTGANDPPGVVAW